MSPMPVRPVDSYRRWLAELRERDPILHAELEAKLRERVAAEAPGVTFESATSPGGSERIAIQYVNIVRDCRPAFPI